jgi:hypothetical protein
MADPLRPTTPARLVAEQLARQRAHTDIAALVRASLDDLRRSERALEQQLGDLRCYLGHAGVNAPADARAR